jgi:SAM-dependent methyltransferase
MNCGYEPELYDLVIPPSWFGDVEWYRKRAEESGGPVLELGAGTGRITLPVAQSGVRIYALDSDQGMLDALTRKIAAQPKTVQERTVIVNEDMRRFRLTERFALIMAPFRGFLHNLTEEDQLACLRSVREHLRPGGRLVFNVFHPSLEYMARNTGAMAGAWRWRETVERPDGGAVVRSEANRYDTVPQRVHSLHRYEEYGPDGTLRRTLLHRLELAYLYPGDIRRLLEHAGFQAIRIDGGFDGRPFEKDADELVIDASG